MKVLIVGRHAPDLGDTQVKILGQENIQFSLTAAEVDVQLVDLLAKASEVGAEAVLLQNVPAVLAGALIRRQGDFAGVRLGVIISVPGPREAGVQKSYKLFSGWVAKRAAEAVQFANNRAQVSVEGNTLSVTVDPVAKFQFSHIEWLN